MLITTTAAISLTLALSGAPTGHTTQEVISHTGQESFSRDPWAATDWEWVMLAPSAPGQLFVVGGKPKQVGSSYGCYARLIQGQDGSVTEFSCPENLACTHKGGTCEERSSEYPSYILVWCQCTGGAE